MLRKIKKALNLSCFFLYDRIAALFTKVNSKKAVFLSESHGALDGNLKQVCDAFPAVYEKKVHVRGDRRKGSCLKETFSVWHDLATAGLVILDDFYGLTSAQRVRAGQKIIQLWHGAGAYKKFGYSRRDTGDGIKTIHRGYKKYSLAFVSSKDIRGCYAEAFGIDISKICAAGTPKTDIFFDKGERERIREGFFREYPELAGRKIVLFAPTYRGKKVEDADYDFAYADLDALADELGGEYRILARWHPALRNNIRRGKTAAEFCEKTYDFSDYKDISGLLIVCDVLVTDYSSIIFDYVLLGKPAVYFVYDREEYGAGRGLYFNFDEYVYGETVSDRAALAEAVKKADLKAVLYEGKRERFRRKFMSSCTGDSTEKVVKAITGGKA